MASKKKNESVEPEQPDLQETADTQEASPPVSQGPPITDYVVLVNKVKRKTDVHLLNGRVIPLGPRCEGRTIHRSEKILRKFLSPEAYEYKKNGVIGIEPAEGGE